MASQKEFILLLEKRNANQCTEEELRLIDEYLQAQHVAFLQKPMPEHLISNTWTRIDAAIDLHENRQSKKRVFGVSIRIAASVLLVLTSALIIYQKKENIYNYLHPVTYTNVVAKKGENVTVNLPDGSVVTLNQESNLSYSNRYNEQLREVSLTGEAYFRVTKDKTKPFIVHTGKLSTKVLGTSFNIEAYPFSRTIAVQLITGKIWLHTDEPHRKGINYILTPNQALAYDTKNGTAQKQNVSEAENYIAWKDGKIRFSNTTIQEAVRRLNITYRSHISIASSDLAGQRVYGEFGINEDPASVIGNLCMLIKAKYKTKPGGEIVIVPSFAHKE